MNIAYLVLAHDQPGLLIRMIDRLNQENVHFFIHVDKKNSGVATALKKHFEGNNNVHIISAEKIYWMGFNMVKATLQLLQLAHSSAVDFKYYVLLSGRDYPIKSNAFINDFFSQHSSDFISYNAVTYMRQNFKDKVQRYHFMDNPYVNPRTASKGSFLVKLYYGIQNRLGKYLPTRKFYKDYQPYFGSQWFALTGDTVKYILDFLKQHKDYSDFMKYTEGPDELFFQTIILNSDRKQNVYDYDRYLQWLKTKKEDKVFIPGFSSLRYMDWSEYLKIKPALLEDSYFEALAESKDLFARKFDEANSAALLNKIDNELLQ